MIAREGQTLESFYRDQYQPLKLRSRSANTKRLYEFSIRNFTRFLGREALLSDFNDETVSRLICWMIERGRSPYTANKERSQLLAIWRFAARKQIVSEWPDVEPEIQPVRVPRAWTGDELARLFAACWDTPGAIGRVPARLWWYGLHLVGWDSGERITPLLKLRRSWLSVETGMLRVPAEVRKGRRADRLYVLHPQTCDVLRQLLTFSGDLIFDWPHAKTHIYHHYDKIQLRAGLPVGREFRFHCLRKAVASHGKAAGLDPQELMGHIDGRTTQRYLDPQICAGKPASEVLFRPHTLPPNK